MNPNKGRLAWFAAVLVSMSACASSPELAGREMPDEEPLVSLVSSGGVWGMHREIIVTRGELIVLDRKRESKSVRPLTPSDLNEISRQVEQLPTGEEQRFGRCRDCIQHTFSFLRGGKSQMVKLMGPLPADSPFRPLLDKLIRMAEKSQ